MDLLVICLTISVWSKYGNLIIGIPALMCSLIEMIVSGYCFCKNGDHIWGVSVGIVCTVLCCVRLFGKNGLVWNDSKRTN